MSVMYKKILRKDPRVKDQPGKFYPQLVTLGQTADIYQIAYEMQKTSALSFGQIINVIGSFVEAMRTTLYNGHAVNIRDFGVFRLSAVCKGVATETECVADNIRVVRIIFRASGNVKPILNATTRTPGEVIKFIDVEEAMKKKEEKKTPVPDEPAKPDTSEPEEPV